MQQKSGNYSAFFKNISKFSITGETEPQLMISIWLLVYEA